ncbi:MAG: DUF167 domain-containing protein [Thermoplasmata archaeon]
MEEKMLRDAVSSSNKGIYIDICLTPGSSRDEIKGVNPWRGCLDISLKEEPVQGAANASLIDFLSVRIGVQKNSICIVKGKNKRNKRVFIKGVRVYEVIRSLDVEK